MLDTFKHIILLLGSPIPRRLLPPQNAIEYYTDPNFRGYLADPEKVAEAKLRLSQKYGYKLPDIDSDPDVRSIYCFYFYLTFSYFRQIC